MITCALSDLFDITYGNSLDLVSMSKSAGGVNFVARTQKNNGVVAKVNRLIAEPPFNGGLISVAVSGSVMEAFLQNDSFYTGFHIMVLRAKVEMSDEVKLFYCHCLRMNKFKYSYGRQANITLPSLQVPCLPEALDFVKDFSIDKLREKMTGRLDLAELTAKAYGPANGRGGMVKLSALFTIKNGTPSSNLERSKYKKNENWIPYIRPSYRQSTSVDAYVNKNFFMQDEVYPAETLYVSTDGQGSHTYSYVSVSEFVPNSNVSVLIPKEPMTLREKLFYAMCISHNRFKFSYGRKPKGEKLESIMVPDKITDLFNSVDIDSLVHKIFM